MADKEFEEFRQLFEQLPQHIKAPSSCYKLAHDIAIESCSSEDPPDPPDPPNGEDPPPRLQDLSHCCSSEDGCCPDLPPHEFVASLSKVQHLQHDPLPSTRKWRGNSESQSPICGSSHPKRQIAKQGERFQSFTMDEDNEGKQEEISLSVEEINATNEKEQRERAKGRDMEEKEKEKEKSGASSSVNGGGREKGVSSERRRRRLPQIPTDQKSFSAASVVSLRTPTLAEELQDAESCSLKTMNSSLDSNLSSRTSSPNGFNIQSAARQILVLKCHSYLRGDSISPEIEAEPHLSQDIDSGHSTQDSPKSVSPMHMEHFEAQSPLSSLESDTYPPLELLDATHRGLYRFIPRHSDEVEIEIGDPIYVQKEAEDLWCEGVNLRSGMHGIFPAAHVTDVDYSDFDPTVPKVKQERFLLHYLGSIETLCYKGNEVLCQAVRKIAREGFAPNQSQSQACILEISDQGIRMVDKAKQKPLQPTKSDYFYHLKHVSFCGFHPRDQRYFGFITKHPSNRKFACHVFEGRTSTRPVAESVGRAFQRFYQKYIETAYPTEDIYLE